VKNIKRIFFCKGDWNPNVRIFHGKNVKAKWVGQWFLQVEAYFEMQFITTNSNWFCMAQFLLCDHIMEWWMTQEDVVINLMGILTWRVNYNEPMTQDWNPFIRSASSYMSNIHTMLVYLSQHLHFSYIVYNWISHGCKHYNLYCSKCNKSLVFHVLSVKNYINVVNLNLFYMVPFLMYYGNMWNNFDQVQWG
jgi:hypothetical protein